MVLSVGVLITAPVIRAADMDITYQTIMDAPKQVSYQATMTRRHYNTDGDTTFHSTQYIVHQQPDLDRLEIPALDGLLNTVVIRIKDDVYRREMSGDSLYYSHRRQRGNDVLDIGLGFSSLDLLQTNYSLEDGGSELLMDRAAVIITFNPKHPGRLTKKAWVDEETGLVLRTEDRDPQGDLVEEIYFSDLKINPVLDPALFDTNDWKGRSVEVNQVIACGSINEVQKEAGFELAAPVYVPAGFSLEQRRVIPFNGQPLVHFVYTDGIAQFSLFQRIATPNDDNGRSWPDGAPEQRGNVKMWQEDTYSIFRVNEDGKLFTMINNESITETESINLLESLCAIKPTVAPSAQTTVINSPWTAGGVVGMLLLGAWFWRRRTYI